MSVSGESKEELYAQETNSLETVRSGLTSLGSQMIDKKRRILRRRIRKKIVERKKREAFPRKGGKYNELFKDISKEVGNHEAQIKNS